ncbi:hypothetical protein LINGRAHAP2_LOCUS10537 [Linum grandiflorum]
MALVYLDLHHTLTYSFLVSHRSADAATPNTRCFSSVPYPIDDDLFDGGLSYGDLEDEMFRMILKCSSGEMQRRFTVAVE